MDSSQAHTATADEQNAVSTEDGEGQEGEGEEEAGTMAEPEPVEPKIDVNQLKNEILTDGMQVMLVYT